MCVQAVIAKISKGWTYIKVEKVGPEMSQGAAKTRTGVFLPFHERVRAKSYNYKMNRAQCASFR